ncbi:ParA family protein [Paraburkholderia strydomiana]|uniref:ParA family protein n=1 Tax=Paraburkholderia strydomiana TaxID=1245417 RepID=UPI0038B9F807
MDRGLEKIIFNHENSLSEHQHPSARFSYKSYCVSNLRGGIGKSTLSFNLAYLMASSKSTLVADLCAQGNLTDSLNNSRDDLAVDIIDAIQPRLLGPAFGDIPDDISYLISGKNDEFKGIKASYFIPSSPGLFAFASSLYQQLQLASTQANSEQKVRNILYTIKTILDKEADLKKCDLQILDCSPFYTGATHLAWCASDALIIPVRVDEHSIKSLELTLDMLGNPASDFNQWLKRGGDMNPPKVAAIVMTMVGARSNVKKTKDRASLSFIERAYTVANRYADLFDKNPEDAFAITDDFTSSGRISGALGIPIPKLQIGKSYTIEPKKRLEVYEANKKYRRELEYLTSLL